MQTLTLKSPAKINLFLHITGKRSDGYHNLQTVFRLIDFYDDMQFSVLDPDKTNACHTAPLALNTDNPITANPADNLVIKAGQALYNFALEQGILTSEKLANLPFIQINLKKNIPMGAGLGGGSSNCATTLLALNQLWQLDFSNEQLQAIGAKIGADVPIFIFGKDAIAEGIGEILTPIALPPQQFLLLTPNTPINTAQLFAHPALQRNCPHRDLDTILANQDNFLANLSPDFSNVFEPVVRDLSSEVTIALNYLHSLQAVSQSVARMSGSGSSVFLPLPTNLPLKTVEIWQKNAPCSAYLASTLTNLAID